MTSLLVSTKKGGFIFDLSEDRESATIRDPILFGHTIYHMVSDPREPDTILLATKTGHLGPTVFRSADGGKTWSEASKPPRFNKEDGKSVNFVFWLAPGHPDNPHKWFAGTSPQGLFVSNDSGDTWEPFDQFNHNPLIKSITENNFGTPIGPLLHSINIDPKDPNHMALAMSLGGIFETTDAGEIWKPQNQNVLADFLPDPYPETEQCVHNFQMHPANPDIWYQQGHCGVYKFDRKVDNQWERIGKTIPIGDIGFPLILHPTDPDTLWVIPMDGSDVWSRTSVNGKPALYMSTDGGRSWIRQDSGLPKQAWFTILRQAAAHDFQNPLGLYFGTKSGQLWHSNDQGENWKALHLHLPEIYAVTAMNPE